MSIKWFGFTIKKTKQNKQKGSSHSKTISKILCQISLQISISFWSNCYSFIVDINYGIRETKAVFKNWERGTERE